MVYRDKVRTIASRVTWVCNSDHKQFAKNISHNLHCSLTHVSVSTQQLDRGGQKPGAGTSRFHSDLLVLAV